MEKVLITGAAGFIGFHLSKYLLEKGYTVFGLDNLNTFGDKYIKYDRLSELGIAKNKLFHEKNINSQRFPNFYFSKIDLEDQSALFNFFSLASPDIVINLAAQTGVRYSTINPHAYANSNLLGFLNILEACRHYRVKHLIYASSSSVYGLNTKMPSTISDQANQPTSFYAATKKSNELMAHSYSHLFGLRTTGLRFFTVYGPWGRPDMAYSIFAKNIMEGKAIKVFNYGRMARDFTYIDDVVEGIESVISVPYDGTSDRYKVYNLGNGQPVNLVRFIEIIETALQKKAEKIFLPLQKGDVVNTFADTSEFRKTFNFSPTTSLEFGIHQFITWFKKYKNSPRAPLKGIHIPEVALKTI